MKKYLTTFIFAFSLLLGYQNSFGQKSQIMDARIDWTPTGSQYTGQLSVYLTDTMHLAGLKIQMGTTPGDSSLYQVNYTASTSGSFYSSGGALINANVLQIGMGNFAYHADYYAMITVMRRNGHTNQIAIHSSN